jgi:two-component system, chemotaxis family, sensor kinase CheA
VDLAKYRALFLEEATEHLAEMSRACLALEKEPANGEAIDLVFRMAHSIKGMAASLDYDAVSSLAHRLEDWMEPLRAGAEFDRSQLGLLAETIAALEEMVASVDETGAPSAAREDLLASLAQKPAAAAANATQAGLKKKVPRPLHRRSRARSAFARRRSIASWPR